MIRATLLAAALAVASTAHAEPVLYDFHFVFGDFLGAASVPAHVQATSVAVAGAWGGLCWNTDPGRSDDFVCGGFGSSSLSFTVTADAGWVFDVNSFSFQGLGPADDGSAPTGYAVYSSLDGFTDALIDGSLLGQVVNHRYDYDAGLTAHDLSGPLELRIVSTGGDGMPVSAWMLDNLRLDLTVRPAQAVPEPGTLPLLAVALGAAFAACPMRRRSAPA